NVSFEATGSAASDEAVAAPEGALPGAGAEEIQLIAEHPPVAEGPSLAAGMWPVPAGFVAPTITAAELVLA
ncbi:hypothetical protein, partial [Teichococcus coralli]|uniref:hypothetical protein n=1 Tax=Teichococcus coralli TaxID=2545983 RepID=UPI001F369560